MVSLLEQLQAQAAAEQAKVDAEKAKIAAEQKATEDSAQEVNKFLVATLESGFESGVIDPRVMAATLERSDSPEFTTMLFANRVLKDSLYGVQKVATGYTFNDASYESVKSLQLAVENFLGVSEVTNFRALLRAVIVGSPLSEPQLKRLLLKTPQAYDQSKLNTKDALFVQNLSGGW